MNEIIYINSLNEARKVLKNNFGENIVISNSKGTTWYLGAKLINKIFEKISQEFHIQNFIFNCEDNIAAVFTAINLGYKNITYIGTSNAIINILENWRNEKN